MGLPRTYAVADETDQPVVAILGADNKGDVLVTNSSDSSMVGLGFTKSPDGSFLPHMRMMHSDVFLKVSFSSTGIVQINVSDRAGKPLSAMLLGGENILMFADFKEGVPDQAQTLEKIIENCVEKILQEKSENST